MTLDSETSIQKLKQQLAGEVILPDDAAYEGVRSSMFAEGHPAVVVQPVNTEDVAYAIAYAQAAGLVLSVRSGGHSGAGHSTNDGGVVIDLSKIHSIEIIDKDARLVRLGGGALWGDVAKTLHDSNLAISSGDTRSVGVGGLTVGAGIGWMVREHGLAIDNLREVEIVTADGRTLTANSSENSDLFWAVRGGGGNFGVVTSFTFEASPIGKVYAGVVTYKPDNLGAMLKAWRDYMRIAPEQLTTMAVTLPSFGPEMPASFMMMCCWDGSDKDTAEAAIKPLRELGEVVSDGIKEKEYYEVLEDAHVPEGIRVINHDAFVPELSDELIGILDECFKKTPFISQIRSVGGAMNRVAPDATAFAHRDSEALVVMPAFVSPTATEAEIEKALETWHKVAPFGKGAYINFFTEDTEEEVAMAYPEATLSRLRSIKKQYDPDNVFSRNFNIKPE